MEFVEVVVVSGVLLSFILFTFLFLPQHAPPYDVTQQPQLTNLAQQTLDRIILTEGDVVVKRDKWYIVDLTLSAPRPLYQPQIDDSKLMTLSITNGSTCTIAERNEFKEFVEETGVRKVIITGFGVATPAEDVTEVDYESILRNFFGKHWDSYDISLRVKPLADLAICPNVTVRGVNIRRDIPLCKNTPHGVWVKSTAGGRVTVTVMYCNGECNLYSRMYNLVGDSPIYQVNILDNQLYNLLQNSVVAIHVQRIDYPRASDVYSFNKTNRPLAYGLFLPPRLWLLHDRVCYDTAPRYGIRKLEIYTGAGFVELGSDIKLNPGFAHARKCSDCQGAGCSACWIEVPANALFALVHVESEGKPGGEALQTLLLIPLVPMSYSSNIEIHTWKRWTPLEPKLQTAVATRVVDSQSTSYFVEVVIYKKP